MKTAVEWLAETKAKDLSISQLATYLVSSDCPISVWDELDGCTRLEKAQILLNKWNAEAEPTEWKPIRGERVLVWDDNEESAKEKIFIIESEGESYPYRAVTSGHDSLFLEGHPFESCGYKHMKPIPKEEPEKDFKSKVVELVEKRITDCIRYEEANHIGKGYYNSILWESQANCAREILKQIKELN